MREQASFSKYGTSFQEGLCQLIFEDRPFADQIMEVLDINFLDLDYLRVFVNLLFNYRNKYNLHPIANTVETILNTDLENQNETTKQQTIDFFEKIQIKELHDSEYIKETALDFCRKQKLKEAMLRSVGLLKKSSFDEISQVINEALILGSDTNFGYDYLVDFEERFKPKFRNPVTTGWDELDSICGGGLGKNELGVVIAPTGAGKSMVLVHLGAQAVLQGKTVIHYTLELQDSVIAKRYDSCIVGYPLNELASFKDEIFESIKDISGQLIIKEYPTKSASTNTIKSHLSSLLKRGIKPGMVIVDYGDLLRPVSMQKEKRNELETIYEELRCIAGEFECPVWTASQTNRSGLNAEVITMESISEAFNKCFVADFIFSVSRTVDDKRANTGRIFVAKNRNGPDGVVYPIFMDTSVVKIKVLSENNNVITSTNNQTEITAAPALSAKEQSDLLKKKYANFRRK
tara:strand:+ start:1117 stop:2499 length:1383 start_codon:yes stop_codon:yes gene_type:complete